MILSESKCQGTQCVHDQLYDLIKWPHGFTHSDSPCSLPGILQ